MSTDGKLNPLEGLSSPVGLGTLAALTALTQAVQKLAGKDSNVVIQALEAALHPGPFANASAEVQKNYKAPIELALKTAKEVKAAIS
jgi:hypothetical protein